MIPREIVHSLVAVYGWYKPVEDVLFTIGVIPREIVHSLVLFMVSVSLSEIFVHYCVIPREIVHSLVAVYGWWKPVGDVLFTIVVIHWEIVHSLVLFMVGGSL